MATHDLTREEGMMAWLQNSEYAEGKNVSSVERLTEGATGFVYRVLLRDASRASMIVKHAEAYASRAQHWKLDQSRMEFEHEGLRYLSQLDMQSSSSVRTPELLFYNKKDHVLIMEDVGEFSSVKGWLRPGVDHDAASNVCEALGRFLAQVHDRSVGDETVKARFNGNATAKYLSGTLYFGGLPAAAARFGHEEEFLREASRIGQQEVDEANDVLTLGDFWTGNVLINTANTDGPDLYVIDLELAKPGTAAFDVGQMAAELYCIEAFREQELGSRALSSFLGCYRKARGGRIDAAKVAIRIGVHLVVIMPRAWCNEASSERIAEIVKIGVDLIRMGHECDGAALRQSIVRPLMD